MSTCVAESSHFSDSKSLETYLCSTMSEKMLSSQAILSMHKHNVVDMDLMFSEFACLKRRCLALCLLPLIHWKHYKRVSPIIKHTIHYPKGCHINSIRYHNTQATSPHLGNQLSQVETKVDDPRARIS